MQRTAASLFGRCARVIISDKKPSYEEIQHSKWLSSTLFQQGFVDETENNRDKTTFVQSPTKDSISLKRSISESTFYSSVPDAESIVDRNFLDEISENSSNSNGAKLHQIIQKQLPVDPTDSLGGYHLSRTVSSFIAAAIKHLGLTNASLNFIQNESSLNPKVLYTINEQLVQIWKLGRQLRSFIVRKRHQLRKEYETQFAESTDSEEKIAEDKQKVEDSLSYEGVCAPILSKALFLLSVRSCHENVDFSKIDNSNSFASSSSASNLLELSKMETHSPKQSAWKAVNESWRALQRSVIRHRSKQLKEHENLITNESLPDLLLHFVQSDTSLKDFQRFIHCHQIRAKNRCIGLQSVHSLLISLKSKSSIISILNS